MNAVKDIAFWISLMDITFGLQFQNGFFTLNLRMLHQVKEDMRYFLAIFSPSLFKGYSASIRNGCLCTSQNQHRWLGDKT